jgi:uncharacterized protein (TIGR02594 family)
MRSAWCMATGSRPWKLLLLAIVAGCGETPAAVPVTPAAQHARAETPIQLKMLHEAEQALGLHARRDRRRLREYHRLGNGGVPVDPVATPWCAAFVNSVMAAVGETGTGSLAARAFLGWGTPTQDPHPGDVVVLRRGGPGEGHVGFFMGFTGEGRDRHMIVLGGNQDYSVSVRAYPLRSLLGYRTLTRTQVPP